LAARLTDPPAGFGGAVAEAGLNLGDRVDGRALGTGEIWGFDDLSGDGPERN